MHNKSKNIKDLNIRSMLHLMAMVENKFIPSNAGLDLNEASGNVTHQMRRIEKSFDFDVFVWGKRKEDHIKFHVIKLTKEGELLHRSMKWFVNSLLIGSEELQIKEL